MPACHSSPRPLMLLAAHVAAPAAPSSRRRHTSASSSTSTPGCPRRSSDSPSRRRPGSGPRTASTSSTGPCRPSNRAERRGRGAQRAPGRRGAPLAGVGESVRFDPVRQRAAGAARVPALRRDRPGDGRAASRSALRERAVAAGVARPRAGTDRRARARARNRSLRPRLASTRLAGSDAADPIHRGTDRRNRRALRAHRQD